MTIASSDNPSDAPGRFYGWINAALLFFSQITVNGFVYLSYAAIFPAMIAATGWSRDTASLGQTIALLFFGLGYPLAAALIGRFGVRFTLTTGMAIMLAGLLLIAFAVDGVWQWNIVWGCVIGLSLALTGPICPQTAMIHWFTARRATAIGIVITGAAAGGFAAQYVHVFVMDWAGSWRAGWALGAVMVLLSIIAIRFLVNRPEDIGQYPDGIAPGGETPEAEGRPKRSAYRTAHVWTLREVIRTPTVYLMMAMSAGYLLALMFILSHGTLHLLDGGLSEIEAASVISLYILGSGFGRIPAGWLGDRFPLRTLLVFWVALLLASFLAIWLSQDIFLLSCAALVFGFCYGGMLVLIPVTQGNYFGEAVFPKVNATLAPIMLAISAVAPLGAGMIFERTGSYDMAFMIIACSLGISLVAAFFLVPPRHKNEAIPEKPSPKRHGKTVAKSDWLRLLDRIPFACQSAPWPTRSIAADCSMSSPRQAGQANRQSRACSSPMTMRSRSRFP